MRRILKKSSINLSSSKNRPLPTHSLMVTLIGLGLVVLVLTFGVFELGGNKLFTTEVTEVSQRLTGNLSVSPPAMAQSTPGSQSSPTPNPVSPTPNFQPTAPILKIGQAGNITPMVIGDEYMALGDSVAYGLGAPSPTQQGYAGTFYNNFLKRVRPDLLYYRNLAVSGETSLSFFEGNSRGLGQSQYERMIKVLEEATTAGRIVSPVTVTLGANDMLDARTKSQAEKEAVLTRYEANLSRLLDELKAKAAPQATIFVTTYYNPYAFLTSGNDEETAWVRRFNESIMRLATARGLRVVDFFNPIFRNEGQYTWIRVGDVHPNRTGHALLAQTLWQASGYDQQGANMSLTYNPVSNRPVLAGQQLAFKLAVQDNLNAAALNDAVSAGSILNVEASLDNSAKVAIAVVPVRYRANLAVPEYSYILDTRGLSIGRHKLRFEATDSGGLISSLEISFDVG